MPSYKYQSAKLRLKILGVCKYLVRPVFHVEGISLNLIHIPTKVAIFGVAGHQAPMQGLARRLLLTSQIELLDRSLRSLRWLLDPLPLSLCAVLVSSANV